jgi:hypothetical protein
MQKALTIDDATMDAHANTPTIMAGPDQTNLVRQSQTPDGNDNASNQTTETTRQNQHSILDGEIATRTHNHLPNSSNGTMHHGKLTPRNDTETPVTTRTRRNTWHRPHRSGWGLLMGMSRILCREPTISHAKYMCKIQKESTCMLHVHADRMC